MSKNTTFGYTDTAISGVTAPVITVPTLNYDQDFSIISSSSDKNGSVEVKFVNTTTPQGHTELMRIGKTAISNVYANRQVPVDYQLLNKVGSKVLVQVQDTLRVTDTADPAYVKDCPFSVQIVLTGPDNEFATPTVYNALIARAVGLLYDKSVSQLSRYFKGAITPKDL